jgi:hypothetical protein
MRSKLILWTDAGRVEDNTTTSKNGDESRRNLKRIEGICRAGVDRRSGNRLDNDILTYNNIITCDLWNIDVILK